MPQKSRLTYDEHVELGRALNKQCAELRPLSVQVATAYPLSGSAGKPGRKLQAAVRAIEEAKAALDTALFSEHPEQAEVTIYYPGQ